MFDRRLLVHFDWLLFALVFTLVGVGIMGVCSATFEGQRAIQPLGDSADQLGRAGAARHADCLCR